MKTALILVASIVASFTLHAALIGKPESSPSRALVASTSTRPVQEAVATGKRLAKFKKPLVTAGR